jgi:endonuclease YncB( thermonuclease family)
MKMRHVIRIVLLTAMLATATGSYADILQGRVVSVADGDTVTVLDDANSQHKIRLMGIDAPEKAQPFGSQSKLSLSSLVFDKQVTVEYSKLDRYGRLVGKIVVDGMDTCLEQIKRGMAWHYKQYEKEQIAADRLLYARAEDQARIEKRGLWRDNNPIAPWQWRRNHRRTK